MPNTIKKMSTNTPTLALSVVVFSTVFSYCPKYKSVKMTLENPNTKNVLFGGLVFKRVTLAKNPGNPFKIQRYISN
jgi:hypothetical protein